MSNSGGGLTKHTGSFTPLSSTRSFSVTNLPEPAMIVLVMIHEPSTNAFDGTRKCEGGIYADGASVIYQTNSGGTAKGFDSGVSTEDWLNGRTVYSDDTEAPTASIISLKHGFSIRAINNANYYFRDGYTYDWVCYTMPE